MSNSILIQILDESIKRHGGDKPLTLAHLRNFIAMTERYKDRLNEQTAKREENNHNDSCEAAFGSLGQG